MCARQKRSSILLTDAQKTEISEALKKKLNDCYTAITDMEAAKIVSDAIAALPATPTVDDIGTIRSAEEAYNKLTDNQKGYLTQREVEQAEQRGFRCVYA